MTLERWVGADSTPPSVARRARTILCAAEGQSNSEVARVVGVSRATVIACRERFLSEGPAGLTQVKSGRGRKPRISPEKVADIVEATLHEKPEGESFGAVDQWLRPSESASCRTSWTPYTTSRTPVKEMTDEEGFA